MMTGHRIPVVVLGGFLGSGKTTLLKRLLGSEEASRTAVVINEFGEVGLDHLLVRGAPGNSVVLKNGCVCCAIRTDLRSALRDLLDEASASGLAPFERIIIETTGLADPGPVAQTLATDPMLRRQTRLAAIVSTVDGVHGGHQIDAHTECRDQIAAADELIITKGDIAIPEELAFLAARLRSLSPLAGISSTLDEPDTFGRILSDATLRGALRKRTGTWLRCTPADTSRHTSVRSVAIETSESIDWTAFAVWLSAFVHAYGDRVLRMKGILYVPGSEAPIALHAVRNHIHPPVHFDPDPTAERLTRIVFIVRDIDTGALRRSLLDFLSIEPAMPHRLSA